MSDWSEWQQRSFGPHKFEITEEAVNRYYSVYPELSKESVPELLLTNFRLGEFEFLTAAGIPLKEILHGGQDYHLFRSMKLGESIQYETQLEKSSTKDKGDWIMTFFVLKTSVYGQEKVDVIAEAHSTLIHRKKVEKNG